MRSAMCARAALDLARVGSVGFITSLEVTPIECGEMKLRQHARQLLLP